MQTTRQHVELLAPAGGPEAGYAALEYGADAIYLGLERFSARAEAENFTTEQLSDITGYAHSLSPRRRVFVTLNTVTLDSEIDPLIDTLAKVSTTGIDAVVVQDLGVARIVRESFPSVRLHASTQLAIHNIEGVRTAAELGFNRVTMARELTLEEISRIAADSPIEIETFVHGALCYCYSGLCLYSSVLRGKSGNRGRCAYPCRDLFREREGTFAFSMKDLSLHEHIRELKSAGVASFKIEGRKKSALYVAAAVKFYRGIIDNRSDARTLAQIESDMKTIFSRPWTPLFATGRRNTETVDTQTVGHRGAPIGVVARVVTYGRGRSLQFTTSRPIEKHDGIQIDLPGAGKPYGFAVDSLRLVAGRGAKPITVIEAKAGSIVEIELPPDAPSLPTGAPVYCSSSQAVKRTYRTTMPKVGEYKIRIPVSVTVRVREREIVVEASAVGTPDGAEVQSLSRVDGVFETAKNPQAVETSIRDAFGKMGTTDFALKTFSVDNPANLFVPVSKLNELRRCVTDVLAGTIERARTEWAKNIHARYELSPGPDRTGGDLRWLLKTDQPQAVCRLAGDVLDRLEEITVDISSIVTPGAESDPLEALEQTVGRDRIRLAIPIIIREWEKQPILACIKRLRDSGWTRWECTGLASWDLLAPYEQLDIAADWPVYVLNRAAARQVQSMRAGRFVCSPEDGEENTAALIRQFPQRAVFVAYQDTPLFISESCALAAVRGACPIARGQTAPEKIVRCHDIRTTVVSSKNERILLTQSGCRTVAVNERPFCATKTLARLKSAGLMYARADFIYRPYETSRIAEVLRALFDGVVPRGAFERETIELR